MPLVGGGIWSAGASVAPQCAGKLARQLTSTAERWDSIASDRWCVHAGIRAGESRDETLLRSPGGLGLLAGRVFRNDGASFPALTSFTDTEAAATRASAGVWLGRNVWGRYVGAFGVADAPSLCLVRDTMGLATLYWVPLPDGVLFSSELAPLVDVLPERPGLDWEALVSFVRWGGHTTRRTPFRGVQELAPGTMAEFTGNAVRTSAFWDPIAGYASTSRLANPVETIRRLFLAVVAAWCGPASRIYVDLSGGLDSSALLAAVAAAGPLDRIVAGHVFHPSIRAADERAVARVVARHVGVRLLELDGEPMLPLAPPATQARRWDRPSLQLLHWRWHEEHRAAAAGDAIFVNGYGGDQLFGARLDRPLQLADYLAEHGPSAFARELTGTALTSGTPIPRILLDFAITQLRHKLLGQASHLLSPPARPRWLRAAALASSSLEIRPEYASAVRRLSAHRARRALELHSTAASVDRGFRDEARLITHPFLSQPLVEAALRLPIEEVVSARADRIAFRAAMRGLLPPAVADRQAKGDYTGMYALGARVHATQVRDALLGGRFAREGFLDEERLNRELADVRDGLVAELLPILYLCAAEYWLDGWLM